MSTLLKYTTPIIPPDPPTPPGPVDPPVPETPVLSDYLEISLLPSDTWFDTLYEDNIDLWEQYSMSKEYVLGYFTEIANGLFGELFGSTFGEIEEYNGYDHFIISGTPFTYSVGGQEFVAGVPLDLSQAYGEGVTAYAARIVPSTTETTTRVKIKGATPLHIDNEGVMVYGAQTPLIFNMLSSAYTAMFKMEGVTRFRGGYDIVSFESGIDYSINYPKDMVSEAEYVCPFVFSNARKVLSFNGLESTPSLSYMFSGLAISTVESIPVDDSMASLRQVTSCYRTFCHCSYMNSDIGRLYRFLKDRCEDDHASCFSECTACSTYDEVPDDWKGAGGAIATVKFKLTGGYDYLDTDLNTMSTAQLRDKFSATPLESDSYTFMIIYTAGGQMTNIKVNGETVDVVSCGGYTGVILAHSQEAYDKAASEYGELASMVKLCEDKTPDIEIGFSIVDEDDLSNYMSVGNSSENTTLFLKEVSGLTKLDVSSFFHDSVTNLFIDSFDGFETLDAVSIGGSNLMGLPSDGYENLANLTTSFTDLLGGTSRNKPVSLKDDIYPIYEQLAEIDTQQSTSSVFSNCIYAKNYEKVPQSWGGRGPEKSEPTDPITIGGKSYNTVNINGKVWMADNLAYTVDDMPSGCATYPYNTADQTERYGVLYNWAAACYIADQIDGWHLPTKAEWAHLMGSVGGYYGANPKLLSTTDGGNDLYGFNARLGGNAYSYVSYIGTYGDYWTANETSSGGSYAYMCRFQDVSYNNTIPDTSFTKRYNLSVRLVQDTKNTFRFKFSSAVSEANLPMVDARKIVTKIDNYTYDYTVKDEYLATGGLFSGGSSSLTCELISTTELSENISYSQMFNSNYCLTKVHSINLSNATNLSNMFSGCSSLISIAVNAPVATNLSYMFAGCGGLTTVSVNAPLATNVSNMFVSCGNLTTVTSLNIPEAVNLNCMFAGDSNLTTVPSTISVPKATVLSRMFANCTKMTALPTIYLGESPSNVNVETMFNYVAYATSGILEAYNMLKAIPGVVYNSGTFASCGAATSAGRAALSRIPTAWGGTMADVSVNTLKFRFSNASSDPTTSETIMARGGTWTKDEDSEFNDWYWTNNSTEWGIESNWGLTSEFDPNIAIIGCGDTSGVTGLWGAFTGCSGITDISGLADMDVSNVTTVTEMFTRCSSLTSIDALANWNTSNVRGMDGMFVGCTSLTSIEALLNWDLSALSADHIVSTFVNCTNLQSGMKAFYDKASAVVSTGTSCFYNAGTSTEAGRAERAQIPTSWGGDMPQTVTIGGTTYTAKQIGCYTWLTENLDYKFSGCTIQELPGSNAFPVACYPNNDEATYGRDGKKYGLLYNWYAVKKLEDNKATLIPGWHVATVEEYNDMREHSTDYANAAKLLKSAEPTWDGTDSLGFSAVPSGTYFDSRYYGVDTGSGDLWVYDADKLSSSTKTILMLRTNTDEFKFGETSPYYGMAVRLVKDH